MCLFPLPNTLFDSSAYKAGLTKFNCGYCPECLRQRASVWALRAVHEARDHAFNSMVCLTYDQYVRDSRGKIIGERVSDLKVDKRDIQLFMKRLRKYFAGDGESNIKYIACAEYGKRTHRAHYHVLLFGVKFPDCVPYKKSKRGNQIYRSAILESLWKNGICTVDSQTVTSASARYCTKYCAKDTRTDDTFMLFSHNIGLSSLITDFNGKSYIVEGREYPIPRAVWQFFISAKYSHLSREFTFKYKNFVPSENNLFREYDLECRLNDLRRARYRRLRDDDWQYQRYLSYWRDKSAEFDKIRLSPIERVRLLDDRYLSYKNACMKVFSAWQAGIPLAPPRQPRKFYSKWFGYGHLPESSCPNRANDTKDIRIIIFESKNNWNYDLINEISKKSRRRRKKIQISLDDLISF